jgi:hypothetical protein
MPDVWDKFVESICEISKNKIIELNDHKKYNTKILDMISSIVIYAGYAFISIGSLLSFGYLYFYSSITGLSVTFPILGIVLVSGILFIYQNKDQYFGIKKILENYRLHFEELQKKLDSDIEEKKKEIIKKNKEELRLIIVEDILKDVYNIYDKKIIESSFKRY